MILSVSRRTDVPDCYSEWFVNRIKEGFLYVRNPMNAHQVSRISLAPDIVDCIVFWTKNPGNMLDKLEFLKDYMYYFQFTLTGYGKDIEPNLPDKQEVLLDTFKRLSDKIGRERVIWRYDPILLNERYTEEHHLDIFGKLAGSLADYTEKAVISFVDLYARIRHGAESSGIRQMTEEEMMRLGKELARIAARHRLGIEACAEQIDLQGAGIKHGSCIDRTLIERLLGCKLEGEKDKNQRKECGCLESIEVGTYNTCLNGCVYCYAKASDGRVRENRKMYDANSPILCGKILPEDRITERKVRSLKEPQISLSEILGF